MAAPVKNLRDGTLVISDAGGPGGGNAITVTLDNGDLSWSEQNPVDMISDRGTLDHARQGNDVPVEGSFSIQYTDHLDPNSANITPYEAMTKQGSAAAWVSDASNGGDGYAGIMTFTITDPAGGSSEVITFTEVYWEGIDFAEGTPSDTLSANFRCLQTRPTFA
jgi:hypothetical protein